MKIICTIWLCSWLLLNIAAAQTAPFTGTWSFEGNDNGISSNSLVGLSAVSYVGVNKFGPNPYSPGYMGQSVNVQNWSTTLCNQTEYVEFSVQPQGTATVTLTSLSFAFSRSANGPQQLSVRSSIDGFGSDLYSQMTDITYLVASVPLNGPGFSNQSGQITFRIYACNPLSGGATIHLDEIKLNGLSLPVTLLSFTAKPDGDRVQIAWATTFELNANRFVVEHSRDSSEFVPVGDVAAKGTTAERQYYGLTDMNPNPGINYYRLKQIDHDGNVQVFDPVSVLIQANEPAISVFPNPASPDQIHLRLWNADDATVRLLNVLGQVMGGQLDRTPGEADLIFDQPLPVGLYLLIVETNGQTRVNKVLIR